MSRCWGILVLLLLSGCAGPSVTTEAPRQMQVAVSAEQTLNEALALLMEQGYVITQADGALGRIDASLARPPGYRLEVRVEDVGDTQASVSLQGFRGGRTLPADVVEPLFVQLQGRLAR
ncbi:hypothetical protein [Halomonas litopenaei]|uniref:hypothetical protein n=1 Tax=Halomonas litopenaei TaxID=2109328 RepID=UPI001A8E2821|nr:hypothetical protein [Halomonas litopenaei]MBN8412000.1 hypothetical protein [Halomonas litopenaei]